MPFSGQLNNSVVELSSLGSRGVALICDRAICISEIVSVHFNSMLYDFDACFYTVYFFDDGMVLILLVLCSGFAGLL